MSFQMTFPFFFLPPPPPLLLRPNSDSVPIRAKPLHKKFVREFLKTFDLIGYENSLPLHVSLSHRNRPAG